MSSDLTAHHLRTPLDGSARRAAGLAVVVAAQALFLWMFLAADPLEQLGAFAGVGAETAFRDAAFSFAAAWRHGMASNSVLYMPGFFAVAWATWRFTRFAGVFDVLWFALGLGAALALAFGAAPAGAASVTADFQAETGIRISGPLPRPSGRAVFAGVYTLLTWTAFVIGCRASLVRRSLRPLLPVPILTVLLMLVRPWTVDEFTSIWWRRMVEGNLVAIGSVALIPLLAWYLVVRTDSRLARPHRSQAHSDS